MFPPEVSKYFFADFFVGKPDPVEAQIKALGSDSFVFDTEEKSRLKANDGVVVHQHNDTTVHLLNLRDGRRYYIQSPWCTVSVRLFQDRLALVGCQELCLWNMDSLPKFQRLVPREEGFGGGNTFHAVDKKSGTIAVIDPEKKTLHLCRKEGAIENVPIKDLPAAFQHFSRFSLDGTRVIVACENKLLVHDLEKNTFLQRTFGGYIRVATDGQHLVVYEPGEDSKKPGTFFVLDPETLQEKVTFSPHVTKFLLTLSHFRVKGNRLSFFTNEGSLQLFDVQTGKLERRIETGDGPDRFVRFVKIRDTVAALGFDRRVEFWNLATGKCFHHIQAKSGIRKLQFESLPFPYVAAQLDNDTVQVWRAKMRVNTDLDELTTKMQTLFLEAKYSSDFDVEVPVLFQSGTCTVYTTEQRMSDGLFKKLSWSQKLEWALKYAYLVPQLQPATTEQTRDCLLHWPGYFFQKLSWNEKLEWALKFPQLVEELEPATADERRDCLQRLPGKFEGLFQTCLEEGDDISWVYKSENVAVLRELLPDYFLVLVKKLPASPSTASHFWDQVTPSIPIAPKELAALGWSDQRALAVRQERRVFFLKPTTAAERQEWHDLIREYFNKNRGKEVEIVGRALATSCNVEWIYLEDFMPVLQACLQDFDLSNTLLKNMPKDLAVVKHVMACYVQTRPGCAIEVFLFEIRGIFGVEAGVSSFVDILHELFPDAQERKRAFAKIWGSLSGSVERKLNLNEVHSTLRILAQKMVLPHKKADTDLFFHAFSQSFTDQIGIRAPGCLDDATLSIPWIQGRMRESGQRKNLLDSPIKGSYREQAIFNEIRNAYLYSLAYTIFASPEVFSAFSEYIEVKPSCTGWDFFKDIYWERREELAKRIDSSRGINLTSS